jgi:serine/threonine protein kinase/tetratricopeptide (TPR) repeat protein
MNASASLREPAASADARLAELIEELTTRLQAGERIDLEACLRDYPEHVERLEKLLPAVRMLADVSRSRDAGLVSGLPDPVSPLGQLGDFRLLREIGRGGMGVVYEAEQISLGRRVALKVLPFAATVDAKQLQRFKNEAQAAAHLQHPHIVPVHYVGCERGVHFYAMQYVDGQTLAQLIAGLRAEMAEQAKDQAELPATVDRPASGEAGARGTDHSELRTPCPPTAPAISTEHSTRPPAFFRTAAQLGLQAATALEHAHQLGIIHRDIKPANLLIETAAPLAPAGRGVGGEGLRLWITDFGLAHVQGETKLTMTGDLLGTLRYMSPEQALAKRIIVDHRTDIYSLGATLYELLTLEPAFAGEDRQELLRQIAFEEPRPPRRWDKAIPAELETIVLKALEKNPSDRYATAQELAEDLRCFLEEKPIRARPVTVLHKVRKWARRNQAVMRALAGSAVLLAAVVVAGLVIGLVLLGRANTRFQEQRNLADQNFHEALRAVDDYLTQVSENRLLKSPGLQPLRKELLETALKYYQAFVQQHPDEPAVRSELARAYFRVGSIQEEIATKAEAFQAYESSRDLWERLVHDDPANSGFQQQLAECLRKIGRLQSTFLGHPDQGLQALQDAEALYEQLTLAEPKNLEFQSGLARTFDDFARWSGDRGQGPEEDQFHHRALEIWQSLAAADPRFQSQLGSTTMNIGYYYTRTGKASKALESFERARQIFTKLCAATPGDTELLNELRRVYTNIGYVHCTKLSQYPEALQAYDQARQILEQLTRDHPAVIEFQVRKAGIYKQIGDVLFSTCDFDLAEDRYRQAVATLDKIVEADPGNTREQYNRADFYVQLGQAQLRLDHLHEALTSSEKSEAILEELLRRDPNQIDYAIERSRSYELAAGVYRKAGRWPEAMRSYRRAIELLKKIPESSQRQNQRVLCNFVTFYTGLGSVQRASGQRVEAESTYRQVQDMREKYFGDEDRLRGNRDCFYPGWIALAQLEIDSGKRQDARRTLLELRAFLEKLPQPNDEDLYKLACVRAQLSRLAGSGQAPLTTPEQVERVQYLDQAMDALRKAIAAGYPDLAELQKDPSLDPLRDRDDFHKLFEAAKKKWKK